MLKIGGFVVVIVSVLGGFLLSGGHIAALWHPFEILIIGGAALGAFLVANSIEVVKKFYYHSVISLPQLYTYWMTGPFHFRF